MFFNADDDDHDFLSAPGGSKLASLFGVDRASGQGGNESLTYTAPKQPKKKEPAGQQQGAGSLLFATAVHSYKYVDGQYASQGKLGAAVLGNPATQDYRILLYVSKQQQVTSARITSTFSFTIQQNNYGSFYDDSRQTWSLMFDNEQNAVQFAKQIGLAKACSAGNALDTVVTQDLRLGDGGALDSGDLVEVKYTGWLLTNGTFGQEFDSNVKTDKQFKFKIGKGKVIKAWDQGVIGMKKGTKRLLIAPPNLAYGSQGMGSRVPPNSTLIFEVEVVRVKIAKTDSPKPSPAPTPEPANPSPAPSSDVDMDDSSVRGRTKSINEQMNQQTSGGKTSGKAKLISRMAKMGKPMLPLVGAVAAEPDSDEEAVPASPQQMTESPVNVQPVRQTVKPPVVTKPVPQHPVAMETQPTVFQTGMATNPVLQQQQFMQPAFAPPAQAGQQLALYQNPQAILQQQQQAALLQQQQLQQQQQQQTQFPSTAPQPGYPGAFPPPQYPVPGSSVPPPVSQPSDAATPMLLTESRQQNTELRLAVGKISDKVERVMEKLDHMQTQQNGSLAVQSSSPNMEASVLMYNVQRIVQDNERLKKELYEKSVKVESMNEKISELLQSNQMFVEKSQTLLEQRNEGFKTTATQSQARVLALEQDKVQLATELSSATSQLSTLQLEIASLRKKELELHQKLDSSSQGVKKNTEEIDTLRSQHTEDEERIRELTASLKEEKQHRKTIDNKLTHIQEEFLDLKTTKDVLEKNLNERKKKSTEERRQMEEEMEDMKSQLEAELQTLREKLRRQKTSTDAVTAEQVSQVEKEMNDEWKAKSDKLLSNAQEKHNRAIQDLKEENSELEQKVEALEAKIHTLKTSSGSSDDAIKNLQEEIEELTGWKTKYENLRTQASSMKEKYEERISDLEEERDQLSEDKDAMQLKVKSLQEAINTAPSGGQESKTTAPSGGQDSVIAEVKKIMNAVYQQLRSKFTAEETYAGTVVLGAILETIKATTLKLVQSQSSVTEEKEESEEEEEEEEDDLSEDEEEEEDEEKEEKVDETVKSSPKTDGNEASSEPAQTEQTSAEQAPVEQEQTSAEPEQTEVLQNKDNQSEEESDFDDSEPDEPIPPIPQESPSAQQPEPVAEQPSENVPPSDSSMAKQEPEEPLEEASLPKADNAESSSATNHLQEEKTEDRVKEEQMSHIPAVSSRTPPPLSDEEEDDNSDENANNDNKPLFGDDDTVEDTLGISVKPPKAEEVKDKINKKDQDNEEDLKPKPPPPLFGSDDDDDDLDWLS